VATTVSDVANLFWQVLCGVTAVRCACIRCVHGWLLQIMRYVRHLKLQPGYDPNTTHVVYGQVCSRAVGPAFSNAVEAVPSACLEQQNDMPSH
jgi:hypothetical protein